MGDCPYGFRKPRIATRHNLDLGSFYNSGVVDNPNLPPQLRVPTPPGAPPGPPRRLNLTVGQKAALVAFLKTLTDTTVTSDAKFSDPFNYGD